MPQPLQLARPAGGAKGGEDGLRQRAVGDTHLRMPLHRQREGWRPVDREGLDEAVGRRGFQAQAVAQPLDPLVMQRVDRMATLRQQAGQHAAGRDVDLVAVVVPALDRPVVVAFAVVQTAASRMDRGIERAAPGDVHLLEAPAHGQHRDPGRNQRLEQRQDGAIALPVEQHAFGQRPGAVELGRHVGRAAGQHHAVDAAGQAGRVDRIDRGRQRQRKGARDLRHRAHIAMEQGVRRMAVALDAVGGDGHQRAARGRWK